MKLTPETIQATRQWFADNAMACIEEVQTGAVKVDNPDAYFAWCLQRRADALEGKYDQSFSFLQRAHFIQTGKCVALFSV